MKIILCLNKDIQSNLVLNLLLPSLVNHQVHMLLSDQVGAAKTKQPKMLTYLGFLEQDLVNKIIFPLLDKQQVSGNLLTFDQLEQKYEVAIEGIVDINENPAFNFVQEFAPDLIISVRHGKIFKAPLIAIPPLGIINLHSGMLPNYRGVLPTFRAMMHGDHTLGSTLHYIVNPTIDTGDIIASSQLPLKEGSTLLENTIQLYYKGVELIIDAIDKIENNIPFKPHPQLLDAGNYYSFPTQEELEGFTRQGMKLFDLQTHLDFIFQQYFPPEFANPSEYLQTAIEAMNE